MDTVKRFWGATGVAPPPKPLPADTREQLSLLLDVEAPTSSQEQIHQFLDRVDEAFQKLNAGEFLAKASSPSNVRKNLTRAVSAFWS